MRPEKEEPPATQPNHRWFRFGLRSLLLLLTLVGLLCGAATMAWHRYQRPYRIARLVERLHGVAQIRDDNSRPWINHWLVRYGHPPRAHVVLVEFRDMPDVTDNVFSLITEETSLETLILYGTQITDNGFSHLRKLTHLTKLNLSGNFINDTCLANLEQLPRLSSLYAINTQITDAGLEHLRGISSLRFLSLIHSRISDAGLRHIAALAQLEYLELRDTQITNAGLESLRGLGNLKQLDLVGTRATPAGVAGLKVSLPGTDIFGP